jgi:hypothetical protein
MLSRRPSPEQRQAENEARREACFQSLARTRGREGVTMGGGTKQLESTQAAKVPGKVRQAIRDSAKGEECTVRITGVCNSDAATTVWSHYPLNDGGKGMGTKSLDLVGCYCCSACHDVADRRVKPPAGVTYDAVLLDWFKGMARSLVRLAQKGLI